MNVQVTLTNEDGKTLYVSALHPADEMTEVRFEWKLKDNEHCIYGYIWIPVCLRRGVPYPEVIGQKVNNELPPADS